MPETKPYTYLGKLAIIRGIKFTLREIDVIACILTGKIAKSMSTVLGIETRTYETHYSNIKKKLQINTKEQLIDLIETAGLHKDYKIHSNLLTVENTLANLKPQNQLSSQKYVLYYKESYNNITFLELLKRHLNLLNIKIRLKPYETICAKLISTQDFDFCLLLDNSSNEHEKNPILICALNDATGDHKDAGIINLRGFTRYFYFLFALANRLNPDANLQCIKNKIEDALSKAIAFAQKPEHLPEIYSLNTLKTNKKLWIAICIASGLLAIGWFF